MYIYCFISATQIHAATQTYIERNSFSSLHFAYRTSYEYPARRYQETRQNLNGTRGCYLAPVTCIFRPATTIAGGNFGRSETARFKFIMQSQQSHNATEEAIEHAHTHGGAYRRGGGLSGIQLGIEMKGAARRPPNRLIVSLSGKSPTYNYTGCDVIPVDFVSFGVEALVVATLLVSKLKGVGLGCARSVQGMKTVEVTTRKLRCSLARISTQI